MRQGFQRNLLLFFLISYSLLLVPARAQTKADRINAGQKAQLDNIRTAEDLVSGSYQDVLNSFFQLAFRDLSGDEKAFAFSSSIFAVRLKSNPKLNIDTSFVKEKWSRNTNVNWGLKLDSNFHFNGFSVGGKYAIINKRDYGVSKQFLEEVMKEEEKRRRVYTRVNQLISAMDNRQLQDSFVVQLDNFTNRKVGYDELSSELKAMFAQAGNEVFEEGQFNPARFVEDARAAYKKIKNSYANRLVIVAGINASTFSDGFFAHDVSLCIEGAGDLLAKTNARNGLEVKAKANLNWSDDSLSIERDMNRCLLHLDAGLNFVLRNHVSVPVVELKAGASYNHLLAGAYSGETKEHFTLDGTARVHITKDINIPVDFRYDPDEGKVRASLSVSTNFDLLDRIVRR